MMMFMTSSSSEKRFVFCSSEGMVLRAYGLAWKGSLVATGRTHPADATDRDFSARGRVGPGDWGRINSLR